MQRRMDLILHCGVDEAVLRIGDNLRRKIDAGIAAGRFGVIVLSRHFFSKGWPQYELDGLVTREMAEDEPLIVPIWHNITKDEVMAASPSLVGKHQRERETSQTYVPKSMDTLQSRHKGGLPPLRAPA